MIAANQPTSFQLPFASSAGAGYIRAIPVASQISITPGAASLTDGFPPLNFVNPSAGGVPMSGKDLNGILNGISAAVQWSQAGGFPAYNATFSTAIGGYPNGAVLLMASGAGVWMSTADNNVTNPDASGAGWKAYNISPGAYLSVSVAGASNVTLTAVQSANNIINLTGAITANIAVIVPTASGQWTFSNNTTGAFTVTVKTSAGAGIVVTQSAAMVLYCDGTNVNSSISAIASVTIQGAFKNLQCSTTGTTAIVTFSADELVVETATHVYTTLRALSLTASTGAASGAANSLDTGAWAYNTWYAQYVIWNGTTASLLWSLSATAPTLPSGYTAFARVGWIRTQAATNYYPLRISQTGRVVVYAPVAGSNVTALPALASGVLGAPATPTWSSASTSTTAPATACAIGLVLVGIASSVVMAAPNTSYGAYNSATNPPPLVFNSGNAATIFGWLRLEAQSIQVAENSASNSVQVYGWEDNL